MEKAEELLREGKLRAGLRELERARRRLYDDGDVAGLEELAARAEATPDRRFRALAYASRQNVAHLERLEELGQRRPRMTGRRALLIGVGIVAGLALYGLWLYLQGV
jgi:hypothetical protein